MTDRPHPLGHDPAETAPLAHPVPPRPQSADPGPEDAVAPAPAAEPSSTAPRSRGTRLRAAATGDRTKLGAIGAALLLVGGAAGFGLAHATSGGHDGGPDLGRSGPPGQGHHGGPGPGRDQQGGQQQQLPPQQGQEG